MTLTLVIVDDHPVVRDGLIGIFESSESLQVVGEAASGPQALEVIVDTDPDVVLMDLRMPGGDGFAAIRELRRRGYRPRIVVLTTYDNDRDIRRATAAGADAYLLKDLPRAELIEAVLRIGTGEGPGLMTTTPAASALTEREVEVLALVADGCTNRAVARRLGIGEATVKTHLAHIYAKLNCQDRAEAVRVAWERGLI